MIEPGWLAQKRAVFRNRPASVRFATAAALSVLPLIFALTIWPEPTAIYSMVSMGAILASVWFCGWECGLLTVALCSATFLTLFTVRQYPVHPSSSVTEFLFFVSVAFGAARLTHRLAEAHEALVESEQRYRAVGELVPYGAWISDGDGNMAYLSQSFLRAFQVSLEECVGDGWLRLVRQEDAAQAAAVWQRCIRERKPWDQELRLLDNEGREHVILSRGSPLYGPDGQVRSWVGFNFDITDRSLVEQVRIEQSQELARSNAELSQFAYVASHDLQEPLRMIASYLQLLSRRYKGRLDADADDFIRYAVEGANRLQRLIDDLLALSEVGRRDQERVLVNTRHIMQTIVENLRASIEQTDAQIELGVLPPVMAEPTQWEQLLQNLVQNAIKYRKPNTAPKVAVSAQRDGHVWKFCVEDNGIGIPAQYTDRIFGIFQRLHGRSRYPGTGIGLALCKKIVEAHQGNIWAESEVGKGSRFYFTIPVSDAAGDD